MQNKQKLRIMIKIIAIIGLLSVMILSYGQNYLANKNFDKYFYIYDSMNDQIKGFNMTDDERSPVFYWEWSCDLTKDRQTQDQYMQCTHCPMIKVLGDCKHYLFKLHPLNTKEMIEKAELWRIRNFIDKLIMRFGILFGVFLLCFNFWQYKYDHAEWERTPLAEMIKKIKED